MKNFEGLYLVEYAIDWDTGKPTLWLFSRLKNGEKKIEKIKDFASYFYVDEFCDVEANYGDTYTSIFGDRVKKVILNSPKEVYPLRQHLESLGFKHFEADILYNNRFLIDEVEDIVPSNYKKFYLDIETLSEGGFPNVDTTQQPVICLTIYNSFDKKYISWIWRTDFENEYTKTKKGEIRKFSSEKDMLLNMVSYVKVQQPDAFLGWNSNLFDLKYLINRMRNIFSINVRDLSPMNSVFVTKNRHDISGKGKEIPGGPVIKGIVLFDLLNYYRKVHKGELSSFSLNNVAIAELGEEKTDSHHVVDNDWLDNWMNVIKYNIKDVELCVKIDAKCGVFDFFDQMRTIAHVNIDDCKYYSRLVDTFILRYAKQKNIILPSKKPYNPDRVLKGGHVMVPKTGMHKNVIVIDLNQIYPSLIETFNLSPETRVDDGEININGVKFTKRFKGIIPSVLDELGRLRVDYKKRMKELRYGDAEFKLYDMKQQSAKNLSCTIYGLQALSTFRLNNDYVAQTITYLGRELIKWVKEETEKEGYKTIYQDSDSCFVKLPDELSEKEVVEDGKELANNINIRLKDFAKKYGCEDKHSLGLDFEKLYKNLLLVAKKRYAGHVVWKDGKKDDAMQLVGLDAKRSDSSLVSKSLQKNILNMILMNDSKENVINYVKDIILNIKSKSFSEIAIPVKFEKNLDEYMTNIPRVRGAKWANKNLNVNYTAGSKVLMLYVMGENDAICFEDDSQLQNKNIKVDYTKMIDKLVIMKIQKIFEALGWKNDMNKIITVYLNNNKLLEDYF